MPIKAIQDFSQGDDFIIKIQHNPIINLTGAVIDFYLSRSEDAEPSLEINYTVPSGTDATNGIAYIPITSTNTADLLPGKYYLALKRTIDGTTNTIVRTGKHNVGKVECFKNLGA